MSRDPSPALRLCLAVVRLAARLVPAADRDAWRMEWDAELRHRWTRRLTKQTEAALVRRSFGAVIDAAWLRRQFTLEADIVQDAAHGVRVLAKSPAFTAVALLVLAIGIGAATAIASISDALLFRPLPIGDAARVVTIWERHRATGVGREDVAPGNAIDFITQPTSFAAAAAIVPWSLDFTPAGGEPEVLYAARVTEQFFSVLGTPLLHGRAFTREEFTQGKDRVVVLSHGLWQERFGGDRGVIGRTVSLDNLPFTIIGVMPPLELRLFEARREPRLYLTKFYEEFEPRIRASGYWNVLARLKPGVTLEQARAEMDGLSQRLAREYPKSNHDIAAEIVPLRDHLAGSVGPLLPLLTGAALLLLAIACGNVANLLLARGASRTREFAIRRALGAGRMRLLRQMLAESLLLAIAGGAVGLLLAKVGLRAVAALRPVDVAGLDAIAIDARVAATAFALSLIAALLAGLAPAWHLSRPHAANALRSAAGSLSAGRLRAVLIVAEVALALVLAIGAGLLIRSLREIQRVDPGFAAARVFALQVFAWDRNTTPQKRAEFFHRALEGMRTLPGVVAAGAVSAMPFVEANLNIRSSIAIDGRPPAAPGEDALVYTTVVAGDYFRAMSIPLERGRLFGPADNATARPVAIVSHSAAKKFWPGANPVGSKASVRFSGKPIDVDIVGVVGDSHHEGLDRPARPELFLPHPQQPFGSMTFAVRLQPASPVTLQNLKQQVWAIDPQQAFYRTATVDELVSRTLVGRRFLVLLLTGFGGAALLLAAAGLYGVISFSTGQRSREIGVRLALGARPRDIMSMVLGEGLRLALAGVAIGLLVATVSTKLLGTLVFGITTGDPITYGSVIAAVVTISAVSCLIPAVRATRIQPSITLRT
jgi:putative ABC transport system permease protein